MATSPGDAELAGATLVDARTTALLLSVPLSGEEVTARLAETSDDAIAEAVAAWLWGAASDSWIELTDVEPDQLGDRLTLRAELTRPVVGALQFIIRPTRQTVRDLVSTFTELPDRHETCHILVAPQEPLDDEIRLEADIAVAVGGEILVLSDSWTAALAIEQVRPILQAHQAGPPGWNVSARVDGAAPYFIGDTEQALGDLGLDIARSTSRVRQIANVLAEDTTTYQERLRLLKRDLRPVEGTTLLATVFLPPITHSRNAVERFYTTTFGLRAESVPLIRERYQWEREQFEDHVRRYRRIDVIDRGVLLEYLAAPEYYQLPLTVEELREQIENVLQLLTYENYTICLCPDSIDMSYELRGDRLRIRTDRRNKGQPRQGRVSSLTFDNQHLIEVFEREFWTLFRSTEEAFKDREYVGQWLVEQAGRYGGPSA